MNENSNEIHCNFNLNFLEFKMSRVTQLNIKITYCICILNTEKSYITLKTWILN